MIPIYVLAVNIYYWGINTIKNEILDSLKAQNTFYLNSLESEIERIKKMQYDCINDDDLNNLAYASQLMDNIEMTYAIKRLQKRLTIINDSSICIKGVCACCISCQARNTTANTTSCIVGKIVINGFS